MQFVGPLYVCMSTGRGALLSQKELWNSTEFPFHLNKVHLNRHWKRNDCTSFKVSGEGHYANFLCISDSAPELQATFNCPVCSKVRGVICCHWGHFWWSQVKPKGLQAELVQFQLSEYFGLIILEETLIPEAEKGAECIHMLISPPSLSLTKGQMGLPP